MYISDWLYIIAYSAVKSLLGLMYCVCVFSNDLLQRHNGSRPRSGSGSIYRHTAAVHLFTEHDADNTLLCSVMGLYGRFLVAKRRGT